MNEIVESVRRVTDIMGEITAASLEQTAGIDQVNQAIAQMDQVTQQNAALVEEAAAASESMQEQAGKLDQIVSVFKLDGMGATVTEPKPVAALGRAAKAALSVRRTTPDRSAGKISPIEKPALTKPGNDDQFEQF